MTYRLSTIFLLNIVTKHPKFCVNFRLCVLISSQQFDRQNFNGISALTVASTPESKYLNAPLMDSWSPGNAVSPKVIFTFNRELSKNWRKRSRTPSTSEDEKIEGSPEDTARELDNDEQENSSHFSLPECDKTKEIIDVDSLNPEENCPPLTENHSGNVCKTVDAENSSESSGNVDLVKNSTALSREGNVNFQDHPLNGNDHETAQCIVEYHTELQAFNKTGESYNNPQTLRTEGHTSLPVSGQFSHQTNGKTQCREVDQTEVLQDFGQSVGYYVESTQLRWKGDTTFPDTLYHNKSINSNTSSGGRYESLSNLRHEGGMRIHDRLNDNKNQSIHFAKEYSTHLSQYSTQTTGNNISFVGSVNSVAKLNQQPEERRFYSQVDITKQVPRETSTQIPDYTKAKPTLPLYEGFYHNGLKTYKDNFDMFLPVSNDQNLRYSEQQRQGCSLRSPSFKLNNSLKDCRYAFAGFERENQGQEPFRQDVGLASIRGSLLLRHSAASFPYEDTRTENEVIDDELAGLHQGNDVRVPSSVSHRTDAASRDLLRGCPTPVIVGDGKSSEDLQNGGTITSSPFLLDGNRNTADPFRCKCLFNS